MASTVSSQGRQPLDRRSSSPGPSVAGRRHRAARARRRHARSDHRRHGVHLPPLVARPADRAPPGLTGNPVGDRPASPPLVDTIAGIPQRPPHARPEIRPGQRRGRQAELPQPQRLRRSPRATSTGSSSWRASARRCSRRSRSSVAARTRWRRPPARRRTRPGGRSWSPRGSGSRTTVGDDEEQLKAARRRAEEPAGPHPQPDPPRRPHRPHRGRQPRAPQGRHAPHLRLHAEGPRRDRQGARPDRLRGRRQGLGARVLLPQERRRAARPGAPAVRRADAGRPTGSRRSSRPTWPATRSSKGSASTPAGPRRRSTRSRDSDLSLIGTAEITLGGMHADEILDEAALPLKYVGISHCFRTEAGAAGRASKGLYRVHQFTKVEMFAFTTPEASGADAPRTAGDRGGDLHRAGHPLPRARHLLGRPRRPGLPQVRPRGLDARPRRGGRVRRGDQHVRLHRLPGPPAQHPLPARRPEGDPVRPHAQRHGRRPQPGPDRRPGELPAGRRPGRRPRGAPALRRQGRHRGGSHQSSVIGRQVPG